MTQKITGGDQGTHDGFIHDAKTFQYACISAPIDDTDIIRSLVAIGREFHFPIDVDICALPSMNKSDNFDLFQYLQYVSADYQFSTSFLQVLLEERRTRHQ